MALTLSLTAPLKELSPSTLRTMFTDVRIEKYKDKLDPATADAALSVLHRYYPPPILSPNPDLPTLIERLSEIENLGTRLSHLRYIRYYLASHLAYHSLRKKLGHPPIPAELTSSPLFLMPHHDALLLPLTHLTIDLQNEDELRRASRPKTTLSFSQIIQARDRARLDTLVLTRSRHNKPSSSSSSSSLRSSSRSPSVRALNGYLILLLASHGPPPRSSELARIQISQPSSGPSLLSTSPSSLLSTAPSSLLPDSSSTTPSSLTSSSTAPSSLGNTITLNPDLSCTLTLRIHKNSRKHSQTSGPITITYPPGVWSEILRIRTLIPSPYLNSHLLASRNPPISSQQITYATDPYLPKPLSGSSPPSSGPSSFHSGSYSNRDLRQAYAAAHPSLQPSQMIHTARTHALDYLPPA